MPEAMKVLGQAAPLAATDTDLYTSPAGTQTSVSTISVCNRGAGTGYFRIAVRPAGVAVANQHYLYYDAALASNATVAITIGVTLAATDVISVRSDIADLSFSAFGVQVTG